MLAASFGAAANVNALPSATFVSAGGNDANDCTLPTPCRTFDGALPKTATGGVITALDSGTYGAADIDKSITIQAAAGVEAQLVRATIIGDSTTEVVLRNLEMFHLHSASNAPKIGINFKAGAALHVENCVVSGFPNSGITFNPNLGCTRTGCPKLFLKNVISRNNGTGLRAASAVLSIDNSRFENNKTGVELPNQTSGAIRGSVIDGNTDVGLQAGQAINKINVDSCGITNNGIGIQSEGLTQVQGFQSLVYVSNSLIAVNQVGLSEVGGRIISLGNNQLGNNTTDGAFN
jgi:hypothetical protein